jgi:hypothetical protein
MAPAATGAGADEVPSAATAKVDTKTVAKKLKKPLRMQFAPLGNQTSDIA